MTRPAAVAVPAPSRTHRGRAAIGELRAAIAFLTRFPMRLATPDLERTGAAAFGLVGAAIGLVGAVPLLVLGPRVPWPAAVLALLVLVVASGGFHLDGLADTADALVAPTPDVAELARIDPRAGAAGVVAIVLDLLLAASLLAVVDAADARLAATALVVAAAGSRAAAPVAAWIVRIRRTGSQPGLGGWFSARVSAVDVVASIVTIVFVTGVAAIVAGTIVMTGTVAGLVVAAIGGAVVVARRGQLDGDGFGAIVEITFLAILAGIAVGVS
jgi:adenosylcobinamide-GDP ribazoletransferase